LVRTPVARTSAAPGKTRLANFYRVQRGTVPPFYLVDLPGYGYARTTRGADRSEAVGAFRQLTDDYFGRADKRIGVLLLVDARHPGLESDLEAWEWLTAQPHACAIVGTKTDKLTRAERTRHARELETLFESPVPLVSATTGEGLEELWKLIVRLPNQTAPQPPPLPRPPHPHRPPRPPR
jgi:GTP-binding protein